mgnify:CR=1 FL=1
MSLAYVNNIADTSILLVEKGRQKFASRVEKSWVRFNPLTINKLGGGGLTKVSTRINIL